MTAALFGGTMTISDLTVAMSAMSPTRTTPPATAVPMSASMTSLLQLIDGGDFPHGRIVGRGNHRGAILHFHHDHGFPRGALRRSVERPCHQLVRSVAA